MKRMFRSIVALMLALCTVCSSGLPVVTAYAEESAPTQTADGGQYAYETDAAAQTGWVKSDNKWYYYDKSGTMVTGWKKISGKWYYFKANGIMTTGWQKISGKWYYFRTTGTMTTGWQQISGKWYYMNANGVMTTGWRKISGTYYCFASSGAMYTSSWKQSGGKCYYLKASGAMARSETLTLGSTSYTFDANGVCAAYDPSHTHSWTAATCTSPKTCAICGLTKGSALGHDWELTDESFIYGCMDCGAVFYTFDEWGSHMLSTGHENMSAKISSTYTCTRCGTTKKYVH